MMPNLLSIEALKADRRYVQAQLEAETDNPWGTAKILWEQRLEDIDARLAELSETTKPMASVALIFDGGPVVGAEQIRLDFASAVLDQYQKLVSLEFASRVAEAIPDRGPLPGREHAKLFVRDIVHGSMGFLLEEGGGQPAMFPTLLKETVEEVTSILSDLSAPERAVFEERLGRSDPRFIAAVQKLSKTLSNSDASARVVGDRTALDMSVDDVHELNRRLNEIEVRDSSDAVVGVLLGVLPEAGKFELRIEGPDGQTIEGDVSEQMVQRYLTDSTIKDALQRRVSAQIRTVQSVRNGRVIREKVILENISM